MNRIYNELLSYSGLTLFLLIVIPSGIEYYSTNDPTGTMVVGLINMIGGLIFFLWIFGICRKGYEKIKMKSIPTMDILYAEIAAITTIIAFVAGLFETYGQIEYENNTGIAIFSFTISEPVWIPIVFISSLLFLIYYASKSIMTLEKRDEAGIGDSIGTILLFFILPIGIFSIQKKVKKNL